MNWFKKLFAKPQVEPPRIKALENMAARMGLSYEEADAHAGHLKIQVFNEIAYGSPHTFEELMEWYCCIGDKQLQKKNVFYYMGNA